MLSRSVEETERYGEKLTQLLRPGDTIWLYGDLGAGKTALTRGIARGLGVTGSVTSPTYAIANIYDGRLPLAHYDAYRLETLDDLLDIGWDSYDGGIRVAEWAERAGGSAEGICVMLTAQGENEREISLCYLP